MYRLLLPTNSHMDTNTHTSHTHAGYELQSDPTRLTQIACARDFPRSAASCQESKLSYSWDCSSRPSGTSFPLKYQFFLASTSSMGQIERFFLLFIYFFFCFSVRIIEKLILCNMMNVQRHQPLYVREHGKGT